MSCLDTWFSVWLDFYTWIWAVLLLIQVTIVLFLWVHGRTDKTFRGAFFVFFGAVTVVDGFIIYLASEGKNPSTEEAAYDELGCPADWSVWQNFETWFWATFMLIQVTTLVFLVVQGRRDKSFRQAFYVFFVAVTVVDFVLVLWRPPSLEYQFDETIFGPYYECPYVEDPMREDVMAYKAPITSINDVTMRFIIPVFVHAQPLFLTAIAMNRLTALCFPLKHAALWSARAVAVIVIVLAMTAVMLGAGTSVVSVVLQAVICSAATAKEREDLNCEAWWVFYQISITMMFVLGSTGKLRQKAPELRLFGCMLDHPNEERPMCPTWYRILIGEQLLREKRYSKFTVRSLLQTLLAISGSGFLLLISGHVRNAYFTFYVGCLRREQKQCSSVRVVQVAPARQTVVSSSRNTL